MNVIRLTSNLRADGLLWLVLAGLDLSAIVLVSHQESLALPFEYLSQSIRQSRWAIFFLIGD